MQTLHTDVLVIGSGGAGLLAALHAFDRIPDSDITIAAKGLIGKSGCTRMVQGGYNVALAEGDSVERHFADTIAGGQWINDQELAWTLASTAAERVMELENRYGCLFDRNPDGTIHQKAFAGQSFDRTVHKGDLTGIEIMNRLMEQVRARPIRLLEEYRATALMPSADRERISGALFIDIRSGKPWLINAKAVVIATGAGPTMYKYHTPSADKACDGLAMAIRFGLELRDMEMVQFHPTGLLAGTGTRITGTIIEEGLRGAGGHLLDGNGDRFMHRFDEREERATRDIVSRAMLEQMRGGVTGPNGGVFLSMAHLPADKVRGEFKGMVERCADVGFDLVTGQVEVTPTAHYVMGGIVIDTSCRTSCPGLFAAGEDTGGVHGANRLGGNGVGNATVFGGIAGDAVAEWVGRCEDHAEPSAEYVNQEVQLRHSPFERPAADLNVYRERLHEIMWEHAGILRSSESLSLAQDELESLSLELSESGIGEGTREYNMNWQEYLNLENLILTSCSIVSAAQTRRESCGAHYLTDSPNAGPLADSRYTRTYLAEDGIRSETSAVKFTRMAPDGSSQHLGSGK